MQAAAESLEGGVGVLINNAGYSQSGALETLPMDAVRRQFETNVFGLLRLTQLVLPGMRAAGAGKIVNVSSMGGRLTFPGGGAYHATKYAVEAMSDALRMEVARFGIDVICIEPGLIRTEFGSTAAGGVEASGRSVRRVQRVGGEVHPRRLRGAAVAPRRRRRRRRQAIEKALGKSRAPSRVPVTPSARVMMGLRRVLPDRAWDKVVGAALQVKRIEPSSAPRTRSGRVLDELRAGRKTSHWMWFVFPQIAGLGRSPTRGATRWPALEEAREYLAHPVLGPRLREVTELVAGHSGLSAFDIFGGIDAIKLHSSMTLFAHAARTTRCSGPSSTATSTPRPTRDALDRI